MDTFIQTAGVFIGIPSLFLLLEVVAGLLTRAGTMRGGAESDQRAPRGVILIPAHDEERVIGEVLERLAPFVDEGMQAIVIADNCTDSTAQVARDAGVRVLERHDPDLRGKPYALAWALERIAGDPPEVVLFLDADSWFSRGGPSELMAVSHARQRPVQAIYGMVGGGLRCFAFRFRNEARLRGLAAMGGPVAITGSGFAVPWDLIRRFPVPLGELVEDAFWGWSFTTAGVGPLLVPQVEVSSRLPESRQGTRTQMRRWEHGILHATMRNLPRLTRSALLPPRPPRILHLLDVLVPPLALLVLVSSVVLVLALLLGGPGAWIPAGCATAATTLAVLLGWAGYGRQDVSPLRLLSAPFYALGKIGHYLSFLFRRQKGWNRTERDSDPS